MLGGDYMTGTVKWFNAVKGFGFIANDAGGDDVFIHSSALPAQIRDLDDGQKVTFDIEKDPKNGKECAANITLV